MTERTGPQGQDNQDGATVAEKAWKIVSICRLLVQNKWDRTANTSQSVPVRLIGKPGQYRYIRQGGNDRQQHQLSCEQGG
jgi:hypothetical protein